VVFRQAIEMLDPDPEPGIQFRKREHFRKLQNSVAFFFSPEEHLTNAGIRWLILVQGFDSIMVKIEGVSAEFMRGSAREEKNPGIRYRTIYINIGADL
jgi:hypothetical protein